MIILYIARSTFERETYEKGCDREDEDDIEKQVEQNRLRSVSHATHGIVHGSEGQGVGYWAEEGSQKAAYVSEG